MNLFPDDIFDLYKAVKEIIGMVIITVYVFLEYLLGMNSSINSLNKSLLIVSKIISVFIFVALIYVVYKLYNYFVK